MTATLTAPVATGPAARTSRVALVVAGVLFLLYPALRPWGDSTVDGMAAAFSSPAWLAAHTAAMIGFVLAGFGLVPVARRAAVVWGIGAAMVLPYYGAEAFSLHALGSRFSGAELASLADAVRYGIVPMTLFGIGLVLLAVAGVMTAVRLGWRGVPFAVAAVLYLPQFWLPAELRITHGVLLAVGCVLVALAPRR
ncbi:hypothetical protein [Pseudonocardia ailaonensis]